MKAAAIIMMGMIFVLLGMYMGKVGFSSPAKYPLTDTTFIHQDGSSFYLIQISRLDTDNVPKENYHD